MAERGTCRGGQGVDRGPLVGGGDRAVLGGGKGCGTAGSMLGGRDC